MDVNPVGPAEKLPDGAPSHAWASRLLHGVFAAIASQYPEATAVALEDDALSYAELDRRASALAARLRRDGVGPEVLVGLATERSLEMVIGVLAVLKAGGAYVPLDTSYPPERLRFMIEDCGAPVLLTQAHVAPRLPNVPGLEVVVLGDAAWEGEALPAEADDALPEHLAYVIYTSGSTGKPKGVPVRHEAVVNLARQAIEGMEVASGSRVLQLASFSFDASVLEMVMALLTGSCLQLVPSQTLLSGESLGEAMARYAITAMAIPPSLLNTVPPGPFPALRSIVVGGEACPAETANRWSEGRLFFNAYAPTEATIYVTVKRCRPGRPEPPALGRPIAGAELRLLDRDLAPVAAGAAGEIYLGGLCLARGYHRRPRLTAERFVPDPLATEPGARLYKTGDLARWSERPDGRTELLFVGRADAQVKIRGLRIELGEIEETLRQHPAVHDAVVVARDGLVAGAGDKRLAAYFVLAEGAALPSARALRAFLAERLPTFMVPTAYVHLETIPITLTGKADRAALPAPGEDRETLSSPFVAPADELERELCQVWSELLGGREVGVEDNLFELGGHSLSIAQIAAHVRRRYGAEIPLTELYGTPTVATLARLVRTPGTAAVPFALPPIQVGPRPERIPLTFTQERVWFLNELVPDAIAYNFQFSLRFEGALRLDLLMRSFEEVIRRHEVLRTGFPSVGGQPVQVVHPPFRVQMPITDVSALAPADRRAFERPWVYRAVRHPFDTAKPPLVAWRVLRQGPNESGRTEHLLVHIEHHFVHDGWSLAILMRELLALYPAFERGEASPLPPLPVQYADFTLWQRQWLASGALEAQLGWWREHLVPTPEPLDLPTDRPRPPQPSAQGDILRDELPTALYAAVRARARRQGVSLFAVAVSTFQALVARLTGRTDFLIGSGMANRRLAEIEPMIGMVVNTVVLRCQVGGDPSFAALLERSRAMLMGAHEHQDLPFERLVEVLRPERDAARNPLFSIMFSFHDSPVPDFRLPGLTGELFERHNGSAKMDLNVVVKPQAEQRIAQGLDAPGEMTMVWEYSTDLFDGATIARFWSAYKCLLAAAIADPEQRVSTLPLLTAAEQAQLVAASQGTRLELARTAGDAAALLPARLAQVFAQHGERPALVAVDGSETSYRALASAAARLAARLAPFGLGPEAIAAVLLPRSPLVPMAQLAVLSTGGAYLPLDAAYPDERLVHMLRDSGARVVLTDETLAPRVAATGVPTVVLSAADLAAEPGATLHFAPVVPASLAYVIYTSGSTGEPKAVALHHGGLANLVAWHQAAFGVGAHDRASLLAGLAFDASVWETWPYLAAGAALCLPPEEARFAPEVLLAWLTERGLTLCFLPTPLGEALLAEPALREGAAPALRTLLVGGDKLHAAPPAGLGFTLVNNYGPTECTVVATAGAVPPGTHGAPAIGGPITNLAAWVVDRWGQLASVGVPGELWVGGASVGRGYLGRPALTAERFVPDPWSAEPGARAYRTGDLVRRRADGALDFGGRTDRQVKVRGFRIELGEIEARLRALPGVRECAVLALGSPETRLIGYLALAAGTTPANVEAALARQLPDYMVPSAWVELESFPLLPSGKVDRRALADQGAGASATEAAFEPPQGELERTIAAAWSDVLGVAEVSRHANFFALGGHSLNAVRVAAHLRATLAVELPLRLLFEAPTIAALATRLAQDGTGGIGAAEPALVRREHGEVLPLSPAQERLWFLTQLDPESIVYNISACLHLRGRLERPAFQAALAALGRRHAALNVVFTPEGEQRFLPPQAPALALVDLAALGADALEVAATLGRREAERPFDLGRGPLLRSTLLTGLPEAQGSYARWLLSVHHLVMDGVSLEVFFRDFAACYAAALTGTTPELPELPIAYADYALWQRERLAGTGLDEALAFFRRHLEGAPHELALPADRPRPPVPSGRGELVPLRLPAAVKSGVEALARRTGGTPFMVLLAAYQGLLSRLSGQAEVVVGVPVANRLRREVEGLVGLFINTLPLAAHFEPGAAFVAALERFQPSILGALERQELPFERLVEALDPERNLASTPIFQAFFGLQETSWTRLELPGLEVELTPADTVTAKFDLALSLRPSDDGGYTGGLTVATDLFERTTAERWARAFEELLAALVADPARSLDAAPWPAELAAVPRPAPRPAATPTPRPTGSGGPPRGELERTIAAVWCEVLGLEQVTRDASFYALGGHSLKASRLAVRLRAALGRDVPLRAVFEAPTVAELAARLGTSVTLGTGGGATEQRIAGRAHGTAGVLSPAQERLWFLAQLEPESVAYTVPVELALTGRLVPRSLVAAWSAVLARHEALRTTIGANGEPRIQPPTAPAFPWVDLSALGAAGDEVARGLAGRLARLPFDLERGPLVRTALVTGLPANRHLWLLAFHHLGVDGVSLEILFRDLERAYRPKPEPLPAPTVRYADYAVWQRERLTSAALAPALAFFRAALANVPRELELPADHPAPPVPSGRGDAVPVVLPPELRAPLDALAPALGATPFLVLLTLFQGLLARLSGQVRVAVGTPVGNRPLAELEEVVGLFVNTLVLPAELLPGEGFRATLERQRPLVLGALEHQELPFERLVEELAPERNLASTPLFQAFFAFQDEGWTRLALPGLEAVAQSSERFTAKHALALSLRGDGEGGYRGWLTYAVDRLERATAERWAGLFVGLARALAEDPERSLLRAPWLAPAEVAQLAAGSAATARAYPWAADDPSLVALVRAAAAEAPERVAVVAGDEQISAGELLRRVDRLARRLVAFGLPAEGRVVVVCERGPHLVVAALAALAAGGVYVPVDPKLPVERLRALLTEVASPFVISERQRIGELAAAGHSALIDLDAPDLFQLPVPLPQVDGGRAAYVIFTSGSTGRPKGVVVEHRAIVNRILWGAEAYPLGAEEVVLASAGLSFDFSIWELFAPLAVGHRLLLPTTQELADPLAVVRRMAAERVTVAHFVPSLLAVYLELPPEELPRGLALVFSGGEALTTELARRTVERFGAALWNQYGPTEATVDATFAPVEPAALEEPTAVVPIGRPIANLGAFVVDRFGELAPPGVPGELCLAGVGLARGYLGAPRATAERFVPCPWGGASGARLYRTGDRARWRADGGLDFLGRLDAQVKLRGVRIEPGEIEALLASHPDLAAAAVLVEGDGLEARLVAFCAPRTGTAAPEAAAILTWLGARLLPAMVPAALTVLPELPRTPNGKVDRRALAAVAPAPEAPAAPLPTSPLEGAILEIFAEVLGLARVDPTASFFELGGNSLLLMRVLVRLRGRLGHEVPLRVLFDHPSARELAHVLAPPAEADPEPVPADPTTEGAAATTAPEALEAAPSSAQQRLWVLAQLEPENTSYHVAVRYRLRGPLDRPALARALGAAVARHEALRTVFTPSGNQRILPSLRLPLPVIDLAALGPAAADVAGVLSRAESDRRFDLERGPLVRAALVAGLGGASAAEAEHRLFLTCHHLVVDGWSLELVSQEISELYRAQVAGRAPALPEPVLPFRQWLEQAPSPSAAAEEEALLWFQARLAEAPPRLELPADRPRPALASGRGDAVALTVPAATRSALERLAREEAGSPFMVLLAAWQVLLARLAGQRTVVVGVPVANRPDEQAERVVGLFVNTLALPAEVRDEPFRALVRQVRATVLGAFERQRLPFERLVEALGVERDSSASPIFQSLFTLQEAGWRGLDLGDVSAERLPADAGTEKLDLSLALRADAVGGFQGALSFATDLFDRPTVERWARLFEALLTALGSDPDRPGRRAPWLGPGSREELLALGQGAPELGPGAPLGSLERIAGRVAAQPEAIALVDDEGCWSYAALSKQADRLAAQLAALGVRDEARVAVLLPRRAELVWTLLAIWRAGGAYVPLDPAYPRERLAAMLTDAAALGVVSDGATWAPFAAELRGSVGWVIPPAGSATAATVRQPSLPEHLAYVLFTSGSTGRPKGVAIEHRSVATLLAWAGARYERAELEAVGAVTSICFDLSVFELFVPLAWGGTVVLFRDALDVAERPEATRLTLLNTVPSAADELDRLGALPPRLAVVNLAGEPLPRPLVDRLYAYPGITKVYNLYGPSEDTTYSTEALVPRAGFVPIGTALPGSRALVLDALAQLQPFGVPGELWLTGAGLARGYLGRPALTAERFVPDPFAAEPGAQESGARAYRTGDLVRWRAASGEPARLEYLGRLDHQVKVRGFRIELGEVDAALRAAPGVREAAVLVVADATGDRQLVGYLALADGAEPTSVEASLRARLPGFMVPSALVVLPRLPRLPNGKLDRKALTLHGAPAMAGARAALATLATAAPQGALEQAIAAQWREVLELEFVGRHADFFALGGHSLKAVRLAGRLRELLGTELPLRALFEAPTVAALAARYAGSAPTVGPTLRRRAVGREHPPSPAQARLGFLARLAPESVAYHVPARLRLVGPFLARAFDAGLTAVVARHEALRTTFARTGSTCLVHPARRWPWSVVDLAALGQEAPAEATRLSARETARPFDLEHGPLWRATLLRGLPAVGGQPQALCLLCFHHLIVDGRSVEIFLRDVATAYRAASAGQGAALPPLPLQYADYALWQSDRLASGALDGHLAWFREHLAGAPAVLELPSDRPRPARPSGQGGNVPLSLPEAVGHRLAELGRRVGATPFMTLLLVFRTLLARLSGQTGVVVGVPLANRPLSALDTLVGLFVNVLPIAGELRAGESALAALERERAAVLGTLDHQELPFERLVEALEPDRRLGATPLFQVVFSLQDEAWSRLELPGLDAEMLPTQEVTAKFDLTLVLGSLAGSGSSAAPQGGLGFATDLFDLATVERWARSFEVLAAAIGAAPERPLATAPLLAPSEQAALLGLSHGPLREPGPLLPELLAAAFVTHAERTALVDADGRAISYRQLGAAAGALAERLRPFDLGPEALVAILLPRSPRIPLAQVAVLATGAAFVALDGIHPDARLVQLLRDAAPRAVVTDATLAPRIAAAGLPVVLVEETDLEASAPLVFAPVEAESLAYVIYTSGSTGEPKAVALQHRGLESFVDWHRTTFEVGPEDRGALVSSLAFDALIWDLWPYLTAGGSVAIPADETRYDAETLLAWMRAAGVTQSFLTTALGRRLLAAPSLAEEGAGALRVLIVGGEALPAAPPIAPPFRLLNGYGPTETTVAFLAAPIVAGSAGPPAIGRPFPGLTAWVVDRWGELAPIGVPGELWLAGPQLGRGYLGRPAATAERCVPDPWSTPGARAYRTGDRVRRSADGALHYLGRLDRQLKLRGFRIELGEIESCLARTPGVRAAAVLVESDPEPRLVGVVCLEPGTTLARVRAELAAQLPEPMVPAAWLELESLPLLPSGKLDRRRLAREAASAGATGLADTFEAPQGALEEAIAAVWSRTLDLPAVPRRASFFTLGGHSLKAAELVGELNAALGHEMPLRWLFETPTVAGLAERLAQEAPPLDLDLETPRLLRRPAGAPRWPSPAQERLWFLAELDPQSVAYNVPARLRLRGVVDRPALRSALAAVFRHHEALRSTFTADGHLELLPARALPLPVVDLAALGAAAEAVAAELGEREALRPFDLRQGPLLRSLLVVGLPGEGGEAVAHWLLCCHHLVIDGVSLGLLFRDLATAYTAARQGRMAALPVPAVSYADYAAWQRERLTGRRLAEHLAFFRASLASAPPQLELPTDHPRPSVPSGRGQVVPLELPAALGAAVQALARRVGGTPFLVLVTAFQVLLARLSGQAEVVVGVPVANRSRPELAELVGLFVNTLALPLRPQAGESFEQLLRRRAPELIEALERQELPFERLVEALEVERSLATTPLFQAFFALQDEAWTRLELDELTIALAPLPSRSAKFDLSLTLAPDPAGGYRGAFTYASDLFEPATVERWARLFRGLLTALVAAPVSAVEQAPWLPEPERAEVLAAGAGGALPAFAATTAEAWIAGRVAAQPEAIALVDDEGCWSYAALSKQADRLAARLAALGVRDEARVAVLLPRRAELVWTLLAIWRAGGAYVPLDPAYPRERLGAMLTDAAALGVVSDETTWAPFAAELGGSVGWVIPPAGSATAATVRQSSLPEHLAYVLFTSGSTGRPKGVAIEHRSVATLLAWAGARYDRAELEAVGAVTSICFDLSVFELFVPLAWGGTVVLFRDALDVAERPEAARLTLLNTVPSAADELDNLGALPARLAVVNLAGEPLPRPLVDRLYAYPGITKVYNLYGPSEDTTYSTEALVPRTGFVPIGTALPGSQALVLDALAQLQPFGVPGELWLTGAGLARGYLGRPALTAERFVPDPFAAEPGARAYHTGDLVRWRAASGEPARLEYLGRLDHQVKVRGFRIELGEVEAALRAAPGVREAAVLVVADATGDRQLVGYIALADDAEPTSVEASLRARLPGFMVPSALVVLPKLPRLPNGKLDRKALTLHGAPAMAGARAALATLATAAPQGALEQAIAAAWCTALDRPSVGRHDNFFALGGHSLKAARLAVHLRETLGRPVALRALFEAPTVAGLAAHLEAAGLSEPLGQPPAAAPTPSGRTEPEPTEAPLSAAQERLWFLAELDPESVALHLPTVFGLRGRLEVGALARALGEVVRRHAVLRTRFENRGGVPVQVIDPWRPVPLPLVDLSALPPAAAQAESTRLGAALAHRRLDLARGPLLVARLTRLAEDEHELLLNQHHIVTDGWSLSLLVGELAKLYAATLAGQPAALAPLPLQYADFARRQRAELEGGQAARELDYWRRTLAGAPPQLELPTDRPRPRLQTFRGGLAQRRLPPERVAALRALGQRERVTLHMILLTALGVVLSRLAGQRDVLIGSPVAGRTRRDLEGLIGCFLNTLVLRQDIDPARSFRSLLQAARETALAAYDHQEVPFERVLEALNVERDLARTLLFQVFLNVLNFPERAQDLGTLRIEPRGGRDVESKFDLTLYVSERGHEVGWSAVYNADLFEAARIDTLLDQLDLVLEAATEAERPVGSLSLVPARFAALLPDPTAPLSDAWFGSVVERFAAHARRDPERAAIASPQGAWSYGELLAATWRVAQALRAGGLEPGERVAILAQREAALVPAVLGTLAAGGVFVLLDPAYPEARLAQLVGVAAPRAAIRLSGFGAVPPALEAALVACFKLALPATEAELARWLAAHAPTPPEVLVGPNDPACLTFTSGSTGLPKGVLGRHGSLSHFLDWQAATYGLGPNDRVSVLSGLAHDPLQRDLFTPLQLGAELVIPEPERITEPGYLAAWMAHEAITVAHLTPAMSNLLTQAVAERAETTPAVALPALRTVMLVGELLTRRDVARLVALAPQVQVVNHYGSTETQRAVGYHIATADERVAGGEALPLGRGVADVQLLVRTSTGELAGPGELGEIAVRSPHLALGYLGDPVTTAAKFLPNPATANPGDRLYLTGDLGRYRLDGEVEFVARADNQVKIRGFRVELGEIETTLAQAPGVAEAVVTLWQPATGESVLAAYVVLAPGTALDAGLLRRHLAERLPSYMVPASYLAIPRIPLTPNGKLDRKALPEPQLAASDAESTPAEPLSPLAARIAAVWSKLLQVPSVRSGDDFFLLGGHSLLASRVAAHLQGELGVRVPVRRFFEHPTLAAFAAATQEQLEHEAPAASTPLPPVRTLGERPPRPPQTAMERLLAELWQELLGRDEVGLDDDFFALGGHLVLVERLVARLGEDLGLDVPPQLVGEHPQLAAMARALEDLLLDYEGEEEAS